MRAAGVKRSCRTADRDFVDRHARVPVRLVALGGALILVVAIAAVLLSRGGEGSAAPRATTTATTKTPPVRMSSA
jgi:hypothetical protein